MVVLEVAQEGPSMGATDEVTSGESIVRATSPVAAGVNTEVAVERASSPAKKNSKKPPKSPQKVFSPSADRGKQVQSVYAMWPRFCAANIVIVDS